jgi:putative NADPH-quinone reductase
MTRILIIEGHPDHLNLHFCHALADAYVRGAQEGGHTVRRVQPADIAFPLLRSQREWEHGELPHELVAAQESIAWAEHLVLIYPLWLGDMPAILKGFLEQVARPGFAFRAEGSNPFGRKGLTGRSARVVVTMGMPALLYRWYFGAHSLKSLERNILSFVGIAPIARTLIGGAGAIDPERANSWFDRMEALGREAS